MSLLHFIPSSSWLLTRFSVSSLKVGAPSKCCRGVFGVEAPEEEEEEEEGALLLLLLLLFHRSDIPSRIVRMALSAPSSNSLFASVIASSSDRGRSKMLRKERIPVPYTDSAPGPIVPARTITGMPWFLARLAISTVILPFADW